jgi:HAE1 family hydrophobic/amphiphilic exporter-1
VLVQNRVSSALSQLPQSVQNQGVTVQKKSTAILLFVTLTSPNATYDSLFLSNLRHHQYPRRAVAPARRRQRHGVRRRPVFDAGLARSEQAVGARADAAGRHPAIQQQSQQVTAGQVGAPPAPAGQAFPIYAERQRAARRHQRVRERDRQDRHSGDVTRVRDVGWVELGAQTYSQIFSLNNKPATGIGVFQSPGANALEVEQAVEKKMEALAKAFPQDVDYDTPFDTTKFVSESINEVYKTLIEAGLLVLVVILIFLQDWRAMLVPATTVPVTIIGALRRWRRSASPSISRPVCDRARDRHRGGRRHRGGGRRGAQYREGHVRP